MILDTYKVFNSSTLKSAHLLGYHLLKDLSQRGFSAEELKHVIRQVNRIGSCHMSPLSISRIDNRLL